MRPGQYLEGTFETIVLISFHIKVGNNRLLQIIVVVSDTIVLVVMATSQNIFLFNLLVVIRVPVFVCFSYKYMYM